MVRLLCSSSFSSSSSKYETSSSKSLGTERYKNAKAISSEDMFGVEPDEHGDTPQSRLNKFSGSSGVGSADIFDDGKGKNATGYSMNGARYKYSNIHF